ncbi:MAG: hypothetical protein K2V38_09795 [Gemmataceae bacterium]|nr:hypothetical protein [Gemmataceae bacterium]
MTNIGHPANGTSVLTAPTEDAWAAFERRVREWVGRRVRDLTVVVEDGAVTLDGRTDCFHVKQLAKCGFNAEALVMETPSAAEVMAHAAGVRRR